MKAIKILLVWLCSVPLAVFAQNSGDEQNGGGNSTKIWEPDLVELWVYWHKQQYRMFQRFAHNEDTLQSVQYEKYKDYINDLRKVDEILFNQYQDNDVPQTPFMIPDATHAGYLSKELVTIMNNTYEMLREEPFDQRLFDIYIESFAKTTFKYADLISAASKYIEGWNRENLRDNNFRDNLAETIINELESMTGDWNQLNRRLRTAKYINYTPLK
jgi:hypothetical protein